nr:hypothetical protein [uncultured Mucilaginibacter sp.]
MMDKVLAHQLLQLAGLAQIVLAVVSVAIPKVLGWKPELAKLKTVVKQMVWVHGAYILVINLCLGLVSFFAAGDLLNGSLLAALLTGFIAVYWISRVLTQFFYFDRSAFPKGGFNLLAEVVLTTLFIVLSLTYSWVFYLNF